MGFEQDLIDFPGEDDYPLKEVEPIIEFSPGEDHFVEDPERVVKCHNYQLAYMGRSHVAQNWEFAKYPPKIAQNGAKTRVLHYDVVPRPYHNVLRIFGEVYFGPNADQEEAIGYLYVTCTTGVTTKIKVISPVFSDYGFIDATHECVRSSIVDPPPEDLENPDQNLDVGNVVVGLDIYLEGLGSNVQSNRVQLNSLTIVDQDFQDKSELP